jgi:hypothetical protein
MNTCPFILHPKPDEEVRTQYDHLQTLLKSGNKTLYLSELRHTLKRDIWFLARYVFEYTELCENYHSNYMLRVIQENWDVDTLTLIPRGHCKTTINNLLITCLVINDPSTTIMYVGDRDSSTKAFCAALAQNWRKSIWLRVAFPEIFPSKKTGRPRLWSAARGYQVFTDKPDNKDATLTPLSAQSSPTGAHHQHIFIDDIISLKTNNEKGYARAKSFLQEIANISQARGTIRVIGTYWNLRCPYFDMINETITAGKGPYKVTIGGCYDQYPHPTTPAYVFKSRFNPDKKGGFTMDQLALYARAPKEFAEQYLNAPTSGLGETISLDTVQFSSSSLSSFPLGQVVLSSMDASTGGNLIFQAVINSPEKYPNFPLTKYKTSKSLAKIERISQTCSRFTNYGRLIIPCDVDLGGLTDTSSLRYQLSYASVLKHDDLVDALSIALDSTSNYLGSESSYPVFIGYDCAFTDGDRSDFNAAVAIAITPQRHVILIDYKQKRLKDTESIAQFFFDFRSGVQAIIDQSFRQTPLPEKISDTKSTLKPIHQRRRFSSLSDTSELKK